MNADKINDAGRRKQYHVFTLIEQRLEMPMFLLSLAWIGLLVVELIWGLTDWAQTLVTLIWIVFLLEFALKFVIAPAKFLFLRENWLTVLALALPALRVFRITRAFHALRVARAARGVTLARVLTAFNRGLRSMRAKLGRFGIQYVIALTLIVTGLGAAGIYAFESREAGGSLETFGDALWFTAMLMTTSGSDYWPKTVEGRVLCFLLALYAFAIFGYVTATLASALIGHNNNNNKQRKSTSLRRSVAALQREISRLNKRLDDMHEQKS